MKRQARQILHTVARQSADLLTRRYRDEPFCAGPLGAASDYEAIHREARSREFPRVDEFEKDRGHAVDREWFEEVALLTQVTMKQSAVQYPHGRILYAALRSYLDTFEGKSVRIFETGTARGFSLLCMARALDDHGVAGCIHSFDVLPHDVPIFWNCVADCDGRKKTRKALLEAFAPLVEDYGVFVCGDSMLELGRVRANRVHFASFDGAHDYDNVRFEAETVARMQESGDVIYFDDYNPGEFQGVVDAVDRFLADFPYDAERIAYGDGKHGILARRR